MPSDSQYVWVGALVDIPGPSFVQAVGLQRGDIEGVLVLAWSSCRIHLRTSTHKRLTNALLAFCAGRDSSLGQGSVRSLTGLGMVV